MRAGGYAALPAFLLTSSLDPVDEVVVVRNARSASFVAALERIIPQTGAGLHPIDFSEVPGDLWVQDAVEIGRWCVASQPGVVQHLAVLPGLRAKHDGIRTEPLDRCIREHFEQLGAQVVVNPEAREHTRWIDWYGNLEVSPRVVERSGTEFPFGRVLSGVQSGLGLHPEVLTFLEEQGFQTPGTSG